MPLADETTPATQELGVALQQALDALAAPDRDVFLLREDAGLGYDEIADACDLTIDAVRMRLHRARTALRAALDAPLATERARGIRMAPPGDRGSYE